MTLKEIPKKVQQFVKDYLSVIVLVLAVGALGIGIYNTVLINKKLNVALAAMQARQAVSGPDPLSILPKLPVNIPTLGDANAKLTMIEFGDFQCPYCKRFFDESFQTIKSDYIDTGKIKFVFYNTAVLGQESTWAAEAAMCADEQSRFWDMYEALYKNQKGENQGTFVMSKLEKLAKNLKLDSSLFNTCLESHRYQKQLTDELDLAKSYGVSGTPTFFIKSQIIKGAQPLSNFKQALDANLKN